MKPGQGKHRETARHLQAFQYWHDHDRDSGLTGKEFAVSDQCIRDWAAKYGWHERADLIDREAAARADREAIRRRANMLIKCRQAGELLLGRGVERFAGKDAKIQSDRDAITAIGKGVEIWRQAEGLPTWVLEILNATPEELDRRERLLLERRRSAGTLADPEDEAGTPEELLSLGNGNGRGH